MTKKDECQELKNIRYRGMLEHHSNNNMVNETTENLVNMDDFLEKEKKNNSNVPWTKLDKTTKIKKLNTYVEKFTKENNLTNNDSKNMMKFLKDSIEKKLLNRAKDIDYNKETGLIQSIPSVWYNKQSKKFTLKKTDKRTSTSKSLAPKKPRKTRRVESKLENRITSKVDSKEIKDIKENYKVSNRMDSKSVKDKIDTNIIE